MNGLPKKPVMIAVTWILTRLETIDILATDVRGMSSTNHAMN